MQTWQERTKGWLHDADNIKGFFGDYRWLSNFHICPVQHEGIMYENSEQAYQAAKCWRLEDRYKFKEFTPAQAKRFGQTVKMREDWDTVKYDVMYEICKNKFTRNVDLKEKLLTTGNKYLEETNWWNDRVWGVCNGVGENWLGKILMNIRKELKM